MKRAFITGVNGQDGSYLAELLLKKGYEVHGLIRRTSSFNRERIDHLHNYNDNTGLILHYGDLIDSSNLIHILHDVAPHEIYHLAAQSHVGISFETPLSTANIIALGTLRLLEAIRSVDLPDVKIYNASTSELFGNTTQCPQNEQTPFNASSPYAVAKLYSHMICENYREAYGMNIWNGIFFNHESPRRGENFVTRKITMSIAKILQEKQNCLSMGNIDAVRDWGYAPDYVEAMWKMLQTNTPDTYVIATGIGHSIRDFIEYAFDYVDIKITWNGTGVQEKGYESTANVKHKKVLVQIDPYYCRPLDVNRLIGDSTKARKAFGWKPKTTFEELVKIMMDADIAKEEHTICTSPG
jgi:GDPmannose 4,6-dehydratase